MKQRKAKARARKGRPLKQVAALPFRRTAEGELQVMLITSRDTGRFIIPKGWRMKGRGDAKAAAKEAEEEAGVKGFAGKRPVGRYRYWKRLRDAFVPVVVKVFPLAVERQLDDWGEKHARQRAWVSAKQAELLIDEPELISVVRKMR